MDQLQYCDTGKLLLHTRKESLLVQVYRPGPIALALYMHFKCPWFVQYTMKKMFFFILFTKVFKLDKKFKEVHWPVQVCLIFSFQGSAIAACIT